jgi:hypothetical protein
MGTGGVHAGTGGARLNTGGVSTGGARGIPDAAPSACAPMDAVPDPVSDCRDYSYKWDGTRCVELICYCHSTDCPTIYATAEACDHAYAECYANKGIDRGCVYDNDCALTGRECCDSCAGLSASNVIALSSHSLGAWKGTLCTGSGACPPCISAPNPDLVARCVAAQCATTDLSPYTQGCTVDNDCVVLPRECCEKCAIVTKADFVAVKTSASDAYTQLVCGWRQTACDACAGPTPDDLGLSGKCDTTTNRCIVVP